MRFRIARIDGERLAKGLERFLVAAERSKRGATIIVRLGEFRFLLERGVEAVDRFLVALQRVEDETVVEQNLRRRLAALHRGRDELQAHGRLAFGELDQRHHLQGIDMVGPDGQNFGVEPLGLRQPALLVELQSLLERFRDVGSGLGERWRHRPEGSRKMGLSRLVRPTNCPFPPHPARISAPGRSCNSAGRSAWARHRRRGRDGRRSARS